jgi:hypothetical protein
MMDSCGGRSCWCKRLLAHLGDISGLSSDLEHDGCQMLGEIAKTLYLEHREQRQGCEGARHERGCNKYQ